jgi:hypothetical protein
MPHEAKCHSCDERGEHWHWEGEPFLSRNYRGPCNSCGGKRFSIIFHEWDVAPLVEHLSFGRTLRLWAEMKYAPFHTEPKSQTLYWLRHSLQSALETRLRREFKLNELALHRWWVRFRYPQSVRRWARQSATPLP